MGLIADEVEQVLPEWVVTSPTGYKAITTTGMDALVVEAIRELVARCDRLAETNSALEKRLMALEQAQATPSASDQAHAVSRSCQARIASPSPADRLLRGRRRASGARERASAPRPALAAIGHDLGAALAPLAGAERDGLWLVRRIELELTVDAGAEPALLRRALARTLARAIARRLDRAADGVLFFPDRIGYLARFLADLAAGDAWRLWYYEAFAGLRVLPVAAALRDPGGTGTGLAGAGATRVGRAGPRSRP